MSGQNLAGKVAVVTGASLGIGRSTALALARHGAAVVVNFRSHPDQAEEVVREIESTGGKAVKLQADRADQTAVVKLVADTVSHFGRLDIDVSTAAYSDREPFHEADKAGFRATAVTTI